MSRSRTHANDGLTSALAILTAAAGVIHMAMVPMHVEHRSSMALFLIGGVAQLGLAGGLLFGPRRIATIGTLVVNAGAVGLWTLTRATGVLFLPGFEARQPIEAAGIAATAFEVLSIFIAMASLEAFGGLRVELSERSTRRAASALGAASLVVVASALAVPSDHSSHGHGPGDERVHAAGDHAHAEGHEHALSRDPGEHQSASGEHTDDDTHVHTAGLADHGHASGVGAHRPATSEQPHEHGEADGSHPEGHDQTGGSRPEGHDETAGQHHHPTPTPTPTPTPRPCYLAGIVCP